MVTSCSLGYSGSIGASLLIDLKLRGIVVDKKKRLAKDIASGVLIMQTLSMGVDVVL